MDLYNILLINGLVISIFIYTLGAILLYFPKYNIYGVIIIGIYTILILTAIIYLISLYLNKIIIIIPFIIILCILLIVNLNINSTKCSVFKKNSVYEKPCYETFYTPVGITKLNDGKWCIKNDDGTCRTTDGIIKDIDNPDLNNLKKKLITSQKQCNLKLNDLKKLSKPLKLQVSKNHNKSPDVFKKWKKKWKPKTNELDTGYYVYPLRSKSYVLMAHCKDLKEVFDYLTCWTSIIAKRAFKTCC